MRDFLSISHDKSIRGLALGKFDGMHLAHRILFEHLPEQSALLCIESKGSLLTPHKQLYSPYPIISVAFEEIAQWSGEYFVQTLKQKFLHLQTLVVGYDFAFGKNRAFNAKDLKYLFDGKVIIVPQFCINGIGVHSSLIRELIYHGDMENAKAMLGRYYHICGNIIKGQNLGSKALYATINIQVKDYILPQNGVYASFTKINEEIMPSVSFVGHRLSTDGYFSIETHIIDRELSCLKAKESSIFFVHKIRDNQKYNDLKMLKKQITKDIKQAQAILSKGELLSYAK